MDITFQLIEIDLITTVGMSITLTRSQRENFKIIPNLWRHFNAEIHKIGNRRPSGSDWEKFGITFARNNEYCYLAAIKYTDDMLVPAHMIYKDISEGRYARFMHTGEIGDLKSTVNTIYRKILPERNFAHRPQVKTGLLHFERYDNRFHWHRADSIIEIYVPVD